MAEFYMLCKCVCVYLCLFIRISEVFADNGYYYYDKHPYTHSNRQVLLKLLEDDDSRHLEKRDVAPTRERPPDSYHQWSINHTTSSDINETTRFNNVSTKFLPRENLTRAFSPQVPLMTLPNATKIDIHLTNQQVPYTLPTNLTRNVTEKDIRLLGVNGTGQRKIYPSSTIQPTVISSSYPPLLHDIPKNKSGKPDFDDFVDSFSNSKFDDKDVNATLAEHNITSETIEESYFYYNSTFLTNPDVAKHYWVSLNEFDNATTHELLSSSHRRAANVSLSFEFPFYGHLIQTITITTGGFLYTGDYVHPWLAATQYIAPLMANFDTTLSNTSFVRFLDNGTAFTVLWENVALKDRPNEGEFTFQTTLHKNGDIIFVYQTVPTIIENIKDDEHPVKVGLSDAYIIDSKIFFLLRKTIYEYHRVNFQKEDIKNGTVIILKALPTCLDEKDCESCLTKSTSSFQCVWCPELNKCSSGVDRHRQAWIIKGCDKTKIKNETKCSEIKCNPDEQSNTAYVHDSNSISHDANGPSSSSFKQPGILEAKQSSKMGLTSVLAIMLLLSMIVGITMWVFYAYRNPHTTSGQMLIRYRPSQWTWKRGEARYTAATIHM